MEFKCGCGHATKRRYNFVRHLANVHGNDPQFLASVPDRKRKFRDVLVADDTSHDTDSSETGSDGLDGAVRKLVSAAANQLPEEPTQVKAKLMKFDGIRLQPLKAMERKKICIPGPIVAGPAASESVPQRPIVEEPSLPTPLKAFDVEAMFRSPNMQGRFEPRHDIYQDVPYNINNENMENMRFSPRFSIPFTPERSRSQMSFQATSANRETPFREGPKQGSPDKGIQNPSLQEIPNHGTPNRDSPKGSLSQARLRETTNREQLILADVLDRLEVLEAWKNKVTRGLLSDYSS